LEEKFDLNILVVANEAIKKQRIGTRSDIPAVFVDIIMKHQMPQDIKMQKADIIITNDLDERYLISQIKVVEQMVEFLAKKNYV